MNIQSGNLSGHVIAPIEDSELPAFLLEPRSQRTVRPYPGAEDPEWSDIGRLPWPIAARRILLLSVLAWALIIGLIYMSSQLI